MASLFGSKPQPVVMQAPAPIAAPTPTPVAPLPTADSETVRQQRALNQANLLQAGGRRSTILTTPQSRAPAPTNDSYSAGKFGG